VWAARKALGLAPTAAMDAETKAPLALNGAAFTVPLEPYGVRLVRLQ